MKIFFCGGRELGFKVLKYLCENSEKFNIEIIGINNIPENLDKSAYYKIIDLCNKHKLSIIDIKDLKDKAFDLGLSINYYKILPKDILEIPKKGFFNIHHSYNLRLKGRNIATHAILNSRKDNIFYHGTTLHKMDEKLDNGGIVASYSFPIEENDTSYSLFKKSDKYALKLFKDWFLRILNEEIYTYAPPTECIYTFKNSDLPSKEINIEILSSQEIYDYVRAFDFKGNEPAYFIKNNKKIYLVLNKRGKFKNTISIKNKTYYTQ